MVDWTVLADLPSPSFAADPLLVMDARTGHGVLQAIRSEALENRCFSGSWQVAPSLFGFADRPHAFDAERLGWTWLREPQITGGLAHFLSAGPFPRRAERVRRFLAAGFEAAGAEELAARLDRARIVAAEAVAKEARVDLIAQVTTADQESFGLVVEAKFDHHLTPRQLPAAKRHAAGRGLHGGNSAFVIVLPHRRDAAAGIVSRPENRAWRPVSWWQLLAGFERRLDQSVDDDAFRSLRHTIWHQAYG